MSNEEILKKAVEKAAKNGYSRPDDVPLSSWKHSISSGQAYRIIFSHDFAKAFWGEKEVDNDSADEEGCSDPYVCDLHCGEMWEYRLQRMVISDNPFKYLEKFLDKR